MNKIIKLSILCALIFFVISSNILGALDRITFAPQGVIASINDTFEIEIALDSEVVDLFAYSAHLKYDTTVIKIIDAFPSSDWLLLATSSQYFVGADSLEINPMTGDTNWYYHVFDVLFTNPKKTIDGYSKIATLKFVAKQTGTSPLYYEFYKGTDTLLQDVINSSDDAIVYVCPLPNLPGDVDNDGLIDISDLVYLVDFMFTAGPEPVPHRLTGDLTCDVIVDISDLVWLVDFMFTNGPPPCDPCL